MPCHLTDLLPTFITWLRAHNYAERSNEAYYSSVRLWLGVVEADLGRPARPCHFTLARLENWIGTQGIGPNARRQRIYALRQFGDFLVSRRWRRNNPALELQPPPAPKREAPHLEVEEAKRLMLAPLSGQGSIYHGPAAARPNSMLHVRDASLLELFYGSEVRLSELCGLKLDGMRFVGRTRAILVVIGKGNKQRQVTIGGKTVKALRGYLGRRADFAPKCDALFLNCHGQRLKAGQVAHIVRSWGKLVGVKVHPHKLRHSGTTHAYHRGAALGAFKAQLGHAELATTELYAHGTLEFQFSQCVEKHPRGMGPVGQVIDAARQVVRRAVFAVNELLS